MARPIPYKGEEPYIFISYAHKDGDAVLPIIEQLQLDGFRVWYDEGIDPGTEWDENIASHLSACDFFIAFLSKNYMLSENCKDELYYARDLHKPMVLLYLNHVTLPRGMELRMGRSPSFRVDRGGAFLKKLYQTEEIGRCCPVIPQPPKNKWSRWAVPTALAVILGVAAICLLGGGDESDAPQTEPPPIENVQSQQQVLIDQEGFKVTALGVEVNSSGDLILKTHIQNQTRRTDMMFITMQVNGIYCGYGYGEYSHGYEEEEIFTWDAETLEAAGITNIQSIENVKVMEGIIYFADYQNHVKFLYYPNGEVSGDLSDYTPEEADLLLVDQDDVQLILTDCFYDATDRWVGEFVLVNNTSDLQDMSIYIDQINAYTLLHEGTCYVRPGSWAKVRIPVNDWQDTDYDSVLQIGGRLYSYQWEKQIDTELKYDVTLEDTENVDLGLRQLKESDQILLENEYLQMAVVGAFANMDYCAYRIYCRNLSEEDIFVHFGYVDEKDGIYHLVGSCDIPAGGQYIATDSYPLSVVEKPEEIFLKVECEDTNYNELFIQEVSFTPDW